MKKPLLGIGLLLTLTAPVLAQVKLLGGAGEPPVSYGTITAPGGIAYASGSAEISAIGAGELGQLLASGGSGAPTWLTPTAYLGDNVLTVGTGGQYTTLTAALAAAQSGDIVLLLPGTYTATGPLDITGISVRGLDKRRTKLTYEGSAPSDFLIELGNGGVIADLQLDVTGVAGNLIDVTGTGATVERCWLTAEEGHWAFGNRGDAEVVDVLTTLTDLPDILVSNSGSALYHHTVQITLEATDVEDFTSFANVRFTDEDGNALASWLQESDATTGIYWVRIPYLPASRTIGVVAVASDAAQTSFAAQLVAASGTKLTLPTADRGTGDVDLPTVHPKAIVAQGWTKKETAAGPDTFTRVLIDTPWPGDEVLPDGHSPVEYENPSLWVSADDGLTWAAPPLDGFPAANNIIVPKPAGGNNSDLAMLWIAANSMPNYGGAGVAGPAADTLMIWPRANDGGFHVHRMLLTSTDGSWTGMVHETANTNLSVPPNATVDNFTSPAVVQLADGSLRLWCTQIDLVAPYGIRLQMYRSDDGLTWTLVGACTLRLPPGMWGPWHFDVLLIDGTYWMAGSFHSNDVSTNPYSSGCQMMFMARSADGLTWELIYPCSLRPGFDRSLNDSDEEVLPAWNKMGPYRPSMIYHEEGGLEFYIGFNDRFTEGADGGTGRWVDATWSPSTPREITEPLSLVFWAPARDFGSGDLAGYFAAPLARFYAAGVCDGSAAIVDGALRLTTDKAQTRAGAKMHWERPRDFEWYCRAKLNDANHGMNLWGGAVDGLVIYPAGDDIEFKHNSTAVLKRATAPPGVNLAAYQQYRIRRVGDESRCWVAGVPLTTVADGSGSEVAATVGRTELQDLVNLRTFEWTGAGNAVLDVDWFFWRDAVAVEPVVTVR